VSAQTGWQNPTSRRGWVRIGYNRSVWIPCLPRFPDGYTRESWASECARLWWGASGLPHGKTETDRLAARLAGIHEATFGHIPCHLAFIHLPDPRLAPLPLYVGIWAQEGERESQLRFLTQADDARTARPPIVGPFRAKELGDGLRTLRHRQHDSGSLYASLRYAWRSEEHETDVQLWAACDDLGRLQSAIGDIDEFAGTITVIPRSELRRG
jgi:hypothetical protein